MLWFGGFAGPTASPRRPVNAQELWSHGAGCWSVGAWPKHELRVTRTRARGLAVVGPCGASTPELSQLAVHGVPDDVAWRWPGSYTVVAVDAGGTTIWTDVVGAWPIYTTRADGGIYWACGSRALAGLTGNHVDPDWVAGWLMAPGVPGLLHNRAAFAGIDRVPPGHRVSLPATGMPIARRVWHPQPRKGNHAARLRDELTAAVAVRVDHATAPTVDLSGGYDSTTLALLAADRLQPDRCVTGVTVHPEGVSFGGDLTYARHAAEHPGIRHRLMPLGARHLPYSNLDAVPVTDEPAPSTIAHAYFSAQLQWMRTEFGSDCHLTGDGGDSLLCTPPIMLADLLAARSVGRVLVETVRWARLRRVSVWPLLRATYRTMGISYPDAVRAVARQWLSARGSHCPAAEVAWVSGTACPPWLTPAARDRAARMATDAVDQLAPVPGIDRATLVTSLVMARVGRTARADVQVAEHHGIALHNPFADSRVVDTYLSVPLNERPGPADYKPILRDALADLFPASLAARRTKGSFSTDFYQGMRANSSTLRALADGRLAKLGLVNPAELRRTLTAVSAGVPTAFSTVEPAIAAEVWLRAIDAAPPVAWTALRDRETA